MSYDAECYCADLEPGERCVFCEMQSDEVLRHLGLCLRDAGALCLAWKLGFDARWNAMFGGPLDGEWRPNVEGKPARAALDEVVEL